MRERFDSALANWENANQVFQDSEQSYAKNEIEQPYLLPLPDVVSLSMALCQQRKLSEVSIELGSVKSLAYVR